ncbi:amidohydrolase family protein [Flavobacteriaceae bacterium S0825]|uniref:N-acyl-D-amino-acid deacylase family protein n=1 Tax=Gaetbulibacter sp. S0825 TaxID=2720084 RepID=UPI001431B0FC|nr:amidohydrolase family protein [Gaetbulibacter sp. S0825]MCK0107856.1 amidohydrolase family protein [Flavobacteriaceae bacterium S0825]NIX63492.1 amidohydrolase family protein [Gaetbulibacter sp. S0825]
MKIIKSNIQLSLSFFLFFIILISCSKKPIVADIMIINGKVYDGISTNAIETTIAIKDDKIIYVGTDYSSINAKKTINANGSIVSPGFIDPHTHADSDLSNPKLSHNLPFLMQGVTTVVTGNDGNSLYPTSKYIKSYKSHGIGTNIVPLVGHGTIRKQVMGTSDKKATLDEITKMQSLIQQEMDAGAFGMSTGLFYSPGSYSNTEEVIALAKIVSKSNGIYDTHLRDESSYTVGLIPAIEEAIEIGRQAKLPIHLSHIKCLGVDVWHQSDSIIGIVENAQKEGIEVTANQYPYNASSTSLKAATVPRWAESGGLDSLFIRYKNTASKAKILKETKRNITRRGGPEKLLISKADDSTLVGLNLLEISKKYNLSAEESVYKALSTGFVKVVSFNMHDDDLANFMKQSWVVTGSDGGSGHPRKYGSFPKKYAHYVKKENVIDLGEFVNNSTSKTAEILQISKRGKLEVGYFADIIIFNPEEFKDIANYNDAFQLAEGLEYSIINGELSIENGEFSNRLNGKVLVK